MKPSRLLGLFFATALSLDVLSVQAALTTIDVEAGSTYELNIDADANKTATQGTTGTVLDFGAGCTLRLTGAANGGGAEFPLNVGVKCLSGGVTIDGSALVGYSKNLRWYGCVHVPDGTVTLKGFTKATFGKASRSYNDSVSIPSICAEDVLFDPAEGSTGIEFVTSSALCKALSTCPWSVAPGSAFWAVDKNMINAPSTNVFEADGWTFGFAMGNCVADKEVVVRNGVLLYRHCAVATGEGFIGSWGGSSQTAFLPNDLFLDGIGTGLEIYSNTAGDHTLDGDITGAGSLKLIASSDRAVNIVFGGASDWTGETVVRSGSATERHGKGMLTFVDPSPATSCIILSNETAAVVRFHPAGYGTAPTAVSVNGLKGDGADGYATVQVSSLQTLTVGTVEGALAFSGDSTAKVVVNQLVAGAKIRLVGGVRLQVNASADGMADVILGGVEDAECGTWELSGPSSGAAVSFKVTEVVPGGTVAYAGHVAGLADFSLVSTKIALWCDASVLDSFETIEGKPRSASVDWKTSSDYPYLWSWKDCRPEQTSRWFGNKRYYPSSTIGANTVFGCLAAGTDADAPNGKPYVKMISSGHFNVFTRAAGTVKTTDAITAAYAILVYGSQQTGGGAAILGNQDGAFYRKQAGESWTVVDAARTKFAITCQSYEGFVNGVGMNLSNATARLNGGWQIVSLDPGEAAVQGIGFSSNGSALSPSNRGNCNYAEIMLFDEKPTADERRIVEERLGDKWGVSVAHTGASIQKTFSLNATGSRTEPVLTVADDDSLRLRATINLSFRSQPQTGRYPILAGAHLASWTLGAVTGAGTRDVKLLYDADEKILYADVEGPGLVLILK